MGEPTILDKAINRTEVLMVYLKADPTDGNLAEAYALAKEIQDFIDQLLDQPFKNR
jgi:hypothetical protein